MRFRNSDWQETIAGHSIYQIYVVFLQCRSIFKVYKNVSFSHNVIRSNAFTPKILESTFNSKINNNQITNLWFWHKNVTIRKTAFKNFILQFWIWVVSYCRKLLNEVNWYWSLPAVNISKSNSNYLLNCLKTE